MVGLEPLGDARARLPIGHDVDGGLRDEADGERDERGGERLAELAPVDDLVRGGKISSKLNPCETKPSTRPAARPTPIEAAASTARAPGSDLPEGT